MKKILRKTSILEVAWFLIVLFLCLYFTIKGTFYSSVLGGAEIFVACVFPSMLPYLFITALLSENPFCFRLFSKFSPLSKKLYGTSGAIFLAMFLSFISGYPMGAKVVSDLKDNGIMDEEQAVRGSIVCSSSSPSFLIGSVGAILLKNFKFGVLLFLTHFLSVIINGLIFSFFKKRNRKETPNTPSNFSLKKQSFYQISLSSALSVFAVGGIIIIFFLLTEILADLGIISAIAKPLGAVLGSSRLANALILGTIETTCGFSALASLPISLGLFSAGAFLIGFGGISVIIQSCAFLKNAKIKTAPFIFSKISCAILSLVISVPIYLLFF